MSIKLVVGLRNPGSAYAHTRHNAGAWLMEALMQRYNGVLKTDKALQGEISEIDVQGTRCKGLLPLTFMNHSGFSVRAVCQFYRILPEELLIAHDELDLDVGRIKLKTGGGHGGHNGLRDIISQLGSADFHRLRVGIGHPGHKELVLNYVLGSPSIGDNEAIEQAIERGVSVMPAVLSGRLMDAMSLLNG